MQSASCPNTRILDLIAKLSVRHDCPSAFQSMMEYDNASDSDRGDPFSEYIIRHANTEDLMGDEPYSRHASRLDIDKEKAHTITKKTKPKKTISHPTNGKFKCDKCPVSTLHRSDLPICTKKHVNPPFSCAECNMPFSRRRHLNNHREAVHGINTTTDELVWETCDKCPNETRHSSYKSKHRRRHITSCQYCSSQFCSTRRLSEHIKQEHGDTDASVIQSKEAPSKRTKILRGYNAREMKKRTIGTTDAEQESTCANNKYTWDSEEYDVSRNKAHTSDHSRMPNIVDSNDDEDKHHDNEYMDQVEYSTTCSQRVKRQKTKTKFQKYKLTVDDMTKNKAHHADADAINKRETFCNTTVGHQRQRPDIVREQMHCAFCAFGTTSFEELKTHLDTHDMSAISDNSATNNETIRNIPQNVINIIPSESSVFVDRHDNMFLCSRSSEDTNGIVTGGVACGSPPSIDEDISHWDIDDMDGFTRDIGVNVIPNCNSFDKVDMDIFNRCNAVIESEYRCDFIKKPFACTNCCFATGNIEYLNIHVEAHFLEMALAGNSVR